MRRQLLVMVSILVSVLVADDVSRVAAQTNQGIPQQLQSLEAKVTAILKADQVTSQQLQNLDARVTAILQALKSLGNGEKTCRARRYYLTKDTFDGASALTACAAGFHMASLFEIFDPSALVYDTTLGFTSADSGSGPPARVTDPDTGFIVVGWIRTGEGTFGAGVTGVANCNAWTSNSHSDVGSTSRLSSNWLDAGHSLSTVSPWQPVNTYCDGTTRVWCVQD